MSEKEVRLIDANAIIEEINQAELKLGLRANSEVTNLLREYILSRPIIDPESLRRRGKWNRYKENCLHNNCSVCGYGHCREDNFCPNCGAKMDKEGGR